MVTHDLKIESRWFERVASGEKRAEIRVHDRDFQVGDVLAMKEVNEYGSPLRHLRERDARGRFVNQWVARVVTVRITHVLAGHQAGGIGNDHCLLSITDPVVGEVDW